MHLVDGRPRGVYGERGLVQRLRAGQQRRRLGVIFSYCAKGVQLPGGVIFIYCAKGVHCSSVVSAEERAEQCVADSVQQCEHAAQWVTWKFRPAAAQAGATLCRIICAMAPASTSTAPA